MKKLFWIFAIFLCAIFIPTSIAEAKPNNVEAWQEGTGASAVVKLKWNFAAGDRLFRTFDGDNWTQLAIPEANAEGYVTISDNNNAKGFADGSNVFYEIRDINYQDAWNGTSSRTNTTLIPNPQTTFKSVTVFIGSGSVTTENAHANYIKNTNTCATCHKMHKGKKEAKALLKMDSDRALCETCHTTTQVGSKYLVEEGLVVDKDGNYNASSAGPLNAKGATSVHGATTSSHSGSRVSPGDSLNPGKVWNMDSCLTCHQAHLKDNNFRLLKSVNTTGSGKTVTRIPVPVEAYPVNNGKGEFIRYKSGISVFCSQCHKVFDSSRNSAGAIDPVTGLPRNGTSVVGYNGESFFIHPVDKGMNMHGPALTTTLTLQNATNIEGGKTPHDTTIPSYTKNSVFTCVTCHYSHGTDKQGVQTSNYNNGSSTMLKRMDNQALCQDCHKQ